MLVLGKVFAHGIVALLQYSRDKAYVCTVQRPGQTSHKLHTWNWAASVVVVLHCVVFVILVFAVSFLHFLPVCKMHTYSKRGHPKYKWVLTAVKWGCKQA